MTLVVGDAGQNHNMGSSQSGKFDECGVSCSECEVGGAMGKAELAKTEHQILARYLP